MTPSLRSQAIEIIDQGPGAYTAAEFEDCLLQLERIGKHIGAEASTLQAFQRLRPAPSSILDVGCGGGHFTARLAAQFPETRVLGVDRNEAAIRFARHRHPGNLMNLEFFHTHGDELDNLSEPFDVITSTLVCHHMKDKELVSFLAKASSHARHAVILNDLHRHPLALAGFYVLSRLFYRNRLIQSDGLLSIRKAFRKSDWESLLQAARIPVQDRCLRWCWPFRWCLVVSEKAS